MIQKNSKMIILKSTLFFATLLPIIQGTQLYVLFSVFNPILLVMPVVMGITLGYLIGLYRYRNGIHIEELEQTQAGLTHQVELQTRELQEKNDALEKSLLLDHLTGLGNRIMLKETLEKEAKRITKEYEYLSLFMIDIDYFKKYNDFYGHLHGDEVLKKLGEFFTKQIENSQNIVVRFGGEEFIVILPACDKEKSLEIAKNLTEGVSALEIEHEKSGVSKNITISVGIHTTSSMFMEDECICIKYADEALYLAKEQGRNCFVHSEKLS